MSNAPNIRFRGFVEPWEQRKFGDENDLITGYPFESDKFAEEGIKLVRGMNVKRGYLDFSDEICMRWKSPEGLEDYLLEDGDILIQMDGALIGKSYARIAQNQLPALLVQRVTRARTNRKIADSDFMYQTIQRDFLAYIEMNKTETAVPHLSLTDIRDFKIMVPTLEEQKKIGAFFTNLDNFITLHQRKCNEMSELKKFMSHKMFPKNGEQFPEIRFSGFTDAWEQRKLEEFSDIKTGPFGSALHADDYINDGIPIITTEHFKSGQLPTVKDGIPQVSKDDYSRLSSYILNTGDIVFSRVGSVDINALVTPFQDKWLFSGRVLRVRPYAEVDSMFLHTLLGTNNVRNDIISRAVGQTMPSINTEILKITSLCLPQDIDEQRKIGEYFHCLDNLITLHQRKCEALKDFKKFMLQNMFPKKG